MIFYVAEMWLDTLAYLYTVTLGGLAVYALHVVILIILYLLRRHKPSPPLPPLAEERLPNVTVQVPLRNEAYVVQRILSAVTALDWPRDRLEIQVLDDSDDETTALIRDELAKEHAQGAITTLYHRHHATDHKAGALAAGLEHAQGEYIAIFDADFCPPADFLHRTVPYLVADDTLGMVQARWGHLNAEYSAITRAQALLLDAHFTVEHIARNRSGLLINFNGTAGVWRRKTIEDAGGWQGDTVAEDLDLSYRAQLKGWQALYLPDVVAPAELPPLITAFKQQQYRWAKGSAQCLRKLGGSILRSSRLRWHQKAMALLHLSGYITQPMFLMLLLLILPITCHSEMVQPSDVAPYPPHLATLTALLGTVTAIPSLLYLLGQTAHYQDWPRRILYYPLLMALGLGITWSSTLALIDGFLHWGGPFTRTPKFRLKGREGHWKHTQYRAPLDNTLPGEIFVALYAGVTVWQVYRLKQASFMPFSLIYLCGITLVLGGILRLVLFTKKH